MASTAWERLAEHYALSPSGWWRQWFDVDSQRGVLQGAFRTVVDIVDLCQPAPLDIWPGFMLPDSLPIVSNDYGDWWCLRVGAQGEITEVIHWSHGGGDWLPIGQSIGQAALWDYAQNWRAPAISVEQAAHEYPARPELQTSESDDHRLFRQWLIQVLDGAEAIEQVMRLLESGSYQQALELMAQHDWASAAAACELVELALQGRLGRLADNALAVHCGINWVPDFTSWLFDTSRIPSEARQMLCQAAPEVQFEQDWAAAEYWSRWLLERRDDLSWPGDIAGWAALRRDETSRAINTFFDNRHASAFTDQSVRLRSHWFGDQSGKFSVAQLTSHKEQLSSSQQSDQYLQRLWNAPVGQTRTAIREHWLNLARMALHAQHYADSYRYYMQAGWDLGAERMSDYLEILDGLAGSAAGAGWHARARVASVHAECLRRRLSIR